MSNYPELPLEPPEPIERPERDEDELYQKYKDKTIEEEWDRVWAQ